MTPSKLTGNDDARAVPFSYKRAKPLDLSFKGLESVRGLADGTALFTPGFVNSCRTLGLPSRRGGGGYVTASASLAHNRLTGGLDGLRPLVRRAFHRPDALCWLDVSHNRLARVPDRLAEFPNLRTLYMHHNDVASLWAAVDALRRLPGLRSLTLQNNPAAAVPGYRSAVVHMLPRLAGLDFVRVTDDERRALPPVWVKRYVDSRTAAAAADAPVRRVHAPATGDRPTDGTV